MTTQEGGGPGTRTHISVVAVDFLEQMLRRIYTRSINLYAFKPRHDRSSWKSTIAFPCSFTVFPRRSSIDGAVEGLESWMLSSGVLDLDGAVF